jgi:hypothetical protein
VAVGSDGNLWISGVDGAVVRLTTGGSFSMTPLPSEVVWSGCGGAIAAGTDGNLWASGVQYGPYPSASAIARVSTAADVTVIPLPAGQEWSGAGNSIATGPDGNLWFVGMQQEEAPATGALGRVSVDGTFARFPLRKAHPWWFVFPCVNFGSAAGSDGNVWFTGVPGKIARMHLDEVPLPCDDEEPCTADIGSLEAGCESLWQPIAQSQCKSARRSQIVLSNPTPAGLASKLTWQWQKGDDVELSELASPQEDTTYGLCVWDTFEDESHLAANIQIQPSSTLWRSLGAKGWKYTDRDRTSDGAGSVLLHAGTGERSRVKVVAGGLQFELADANDPETYFRMEPSVVVQLVSSAGTCWTSVFTAEQTKAASSIRFKATAR